MDDFLRTFGKRRGHPWTASSGLIERLDLYLVGALHGLSQVVGGLQPQPCFGTTAEGLVEPDRHLGRDAGMAVDDVGELLAADAELPRRIGDGKPQGLEAIVPDRKPGTTQIAHSHDGSSSMIVHEIQVPGIAACEAKDDCASCRRR